MTPRSNPSPSLAHASPPPPPSTHAPTNDSDSDNQPEERPTHTSEIGTLKKLPNQGTAWLGSSSGVYFVNTVRRAFSAAFTSSNQAGPNAVPASEDILTGEDAEGRSYNGPLNDVGTTDAFAQTLAASLGKPPDRKIAVELVMNFFTAWHPLFPFLHGPSFLKDMESIYARSRRSSRSSRNELTTPQQPPDLRKLVTFQLIINIASLDRSDITLPAESRIKSTNDVARVAGLLALSHDLATIQAILAAELYLVATLAIRQASTVAGTIVKLIYHAGLHRCPLRYAQLSTEDCEIRKRIFWSAYALDRHCTLSLGDPNIIQDDDIDVCLSGPELHKAVALPNPDPDSGLHMGPPKPVSDDPRVANNDGPEAREKRLREAALTAYVQWGKLTGQIIEVFHKSINHRFPKHEQILRLTSDIETWWNDLPGSLSGDDQHSGANNNDSNQSTSQPNSRAPSTAGAPPEPAFSQQHLAPFFKILYHRLLLLVNRPRLSLDQSTPEFQHGLQVCIRASRGILAGLRSHRAQNQSMILPGLLSAAWMSGLIIAFACQLGKYAKARACTDIQGCLTLLEAMNIRWYTVQNCHKVLSVLLANIQSRKASTNGFLAIPKADSPSNVNADPLSANSDQPPRKRQRMNANGDEPSPRKSSAADSATSSPLQTHQSTNQTHSRHQHQGASTSSPSTIWPGATFDPSGAGSLANVNSGMKPGLHSHPSFEFGTWDRQHAMPMPLSSNNYSAGIGSAVYATPQDLAFAQNSMNVNMNLPGSGNPNSGANPGSGNTADANGGNMGPGGEYSDPMFWGNIDYNLADIFGSATWENMTGPFAPGRQWET